MSSLYEQLPIYKDSLDLVVYFDAAVRHFDKFHKYQTGSELRSLSREILFWDCTQSYNLKGDRSLLAQVPANKSLFGKNNLRGLPIGNLTSQFFANIYLNELDQFVKHELKAHFYLRYVDDPVILSQDRAELSAYRGRIEEFLASRLRLQLHPKRRKLLPTSNGIDFLGYIIRPGYILVRRRVVNNLKDKIRAFNRSGRKNLKAFQDTLASYLGHLLWANAYRLTQKMKEAFYAKPS